MNRTGQTALKGLAATLIVFGLNSFVMDAKAQVLNPNPTFDSDAGMWLPNVDNGPVSAPYTPPPPGQGPPIGDGFAPMGINSGDMGLPMFPPPSAVPMPPIPPGPEGKAMATSYAAGALRPPTKYEASDPGMIDAPQDFVPPPVTVTNINPGGGISGDAPITRWGGQTTQDHGRGGGGSTIADCGERLIEKPDLKRMPQFSEDGPRQQVTPGQRGASSNRAASLPGAQTTTDLNGNRTNFKSQRSRLTIAPY